MVGKLVLLTIGLNLINSEVSGDELALEEFGTGNRNFTSDVFSILADGTNQKSLIFSPISAQIILALTAEGARNSTLFELVQALYLPNQNVTREAISQLNFNISTDNFTLQSANKLYVAQNFQVLQSFLSVSEEVYNAEVQNVNFAQSQETADLINDWVERRTNNKIRNLIEPNDLSGATRLVLVNALYLKADWEIQFNEVLTKNDIFFLQNGQTIEVPMMRSDNRRRLTYKYFNSSRLDAAFLELDFANSSLSMTFVLPNARIGLGQIEDNLNDYLQPQEYSSEIVEVVIPRFETTSEPIDLKGILQQLGVNLLFNDADLSGLSLEEGLFVSKVVQKAFINVREAGVEATAATAVVISKSSAEFQPTLRFVANHPFVYFITDRISQIIYFVGRYTGL